MSDLPASDILRSRVVALDLLDQVLSRRTPLDQAIDDSAAFNGLEPRDRGFVRMMVTTALRRMGQVDDIIRRASDRDEAPSPPLLHHILRLGVVQVLFMNVADHAAVDTSVRLAETRMLGRQKGFVNAILRRVTREGAGWIAAQDAARLNVPEWLMKTWIADYGLRPAAEMALASLAEAPLDITPRDPLQADHLASILEAVKLPTGTLRRAAGGHVQDLPGYGDGSWWIQDAAAAIPVRLMGAIDGLSVVDLCAAPGGKTAQLAVAGARVTAIDRSVKRLQRLDENMSRLHLGESVTAVAADASSWSPKEKFDAVLLDAPCSATGTVRRHPDVLHGKGPDDIARMCALQAKLLDHAMTMIRPGGMLVYCTCSLQKDEGERQIDAFLKRHAGRVARSPVTSGEIAGLAEAVTESGDVRIMPFHMAIQGGIDGFYAARLICS